MANISEEILFLIFDFLPPDKFYFILEKSKGLERVKNAFLKKYREAQINLLSRSTYMLINGKKLTHSFFDQPGRIDLIIGTKYWYKVGYLHRDDNKPAVEFESNSPYNEFWKDGIQYILKKWGDGKIKVYKNENMIM